jgi:enterochelin esterase family protein
MRFNFMETAVICCCLTACAAGTGWSLAEQGDVNTSESELRESIGLHLASVLRQLQTNDTNAATAFWREVNGNCPIVRHGDGDRRHCRVTFVWRGDAQTKRVSLLGGFPSGFLAAPLARLGSSDVWFRTETHPSDARFQYVFQINGPEQIPFNSRALNRAMEQSPPKRDPFNPREFQGWSWVELPDAPQQPWIKEQAGAPKGKVTQRTFKSLTLKAEYPLSIYAPPGYGERGSRCWLMVAFDGGFPMMEMSLNNLLAAGKIPPLVVLGTGNLSGESRQRDLGGSTQFGDFVADELVPWARTNFSVHADPDRTMVAGMSLGGFMAIFCGLHHSAVFGKVLALSPTLIAAPAQEDPIPVWDEEQPGLLAPRFASSPRLPLSLYFAVGRYETFLPFSMVYEARRLRDVLTAKGYPLGYAEWNGGHMEVCWRGQLADGLIWLMSRPRTTP